ncbi:MAG: RnfABCDGE type electron transport complex subunit B [Eubacteriales bacterium]|nr:RnfABCDGE type electron transport complex subunit B [Eubacteriales bacterium]
MILNILITVLLLAILGLILGIFLGFVSEKFKVHIDEKELKIRECLPGNNCGGCGYPGCDGLAKAISLGEAEVDACPVGGESVAKKIALVLGVEKQLANRKVAFVHCLGGCDKTKKVYNYFGLRDCLSISTIPNKGEKGCTYACMGYGSCVKVCKFDAIHIIEGKAFVDKEKCTGCSACVRICPMNVIKLVDYNKKHIVACSSKNKGVVTNKVCTVGCIACKMCEKTCKVDGISVNDYLATMNEKCIDCGDCALKCPRKTIT